MSTVAERIEELTTEEFRKSPPELMRLPSAALRLTCQILAIVRYLEEVSPGLAGSAATNGDMAESPPGDVPLAVSLGKPGGLGEDLSDERARLRREYFAERIDEYDAAEYVAGGPVMRQGFPTHKRVQQWRREAASCRAKERAVALEEPEPLLVRAPRSKSLQEQVYALQERLSECDEDDSRRLRLMREVVDRMGWDDEDQQEAGDYLARLKQIADELPELREAKRRQGFAERDVEQARAVRDKALAVIEAARPLETINPEEVVARNAALERLAKAVKEYDWEEIPF